MPTTGSMDHVLDVLASHNHPCIIVGSAAQRWMGSQGVIHNCAECDMLIRDNLLQKIAMDLVNTGHWEFFDPGPRPFRDLSTDYDVDVMLRRKDVKHYTEHRYLSLWSESTYCINVDECPTIEVPDIYSWHPTLIEKQWHPALNLDRKDGRWYGPRLHPDIKIPNLPKHATTLTIFSEGLVRGKSQSNNHPVLVPSLPAYLDALIYHSTRYRQTKPGLAWIAGWQIDNLIRYLYLELPHQKLPLLIELEEDAFMEQYLETYQRKPRFLYQAQGSEYLAVRVKEWDPTSFPDWSKDAAFCAVSPPRQGE